MAPALTTAQVAWRLLPLYFTHVLQAILTTMPFTLAVYMVRDFQTQTGGDTGEQVVGRLTGLLAATFCAAQLVTSYPWGMLSDRIGRKPVMVVGNLTGTVCVLWFGLSASYAAAIASRAVGGAMNAIILAEKAMIGEGLPDKDSQAKAFGLMSLCWGLGSLAGPIIGGALAAPCAGGALHGVQALCGEHGLLAQRPYFLPCLLAGALSAVATLLTLGMAETLPSRGGRYQPVPAFEEREERPPTSAAAGEEDSRQSWQLELQPSQPYKAAAAAALGAGPSSSSSSPRARRSLGSSPTVAAAASEESKLLAFRGDSARALAPAVGGGGRSSSGARAKQALPGSGRGSAAAAAAAGSESESESVDIVVFGPGDLEAPTEAAAAAGAQAQHGGAEGAAALRLPWYKQGLVLRALAGYGLIAFLFNLLDELTPLFASAAVADGGLGFSPSALAPSLSFGGVVLMCWALKGFPWLMRRVGVVRALRVGLWHSVPTALLVPLASAFGGARVPAQVMMFVAMFNKAISGTNAFTGCLVLVNAAAPKQSLGAVNGAGQSLASAVRAAGPALGGLAWGWSASLAARPWWPAWLPHQYAPFMISAAMAAGTDLVYHGLRMPEAEDASHRGGRKPGASGGGGGGGGDDA